MKISTDSVVVITGASRGIGREAAIAFAKKGARVVIASRNEEKMADTKSAVEAAGGEALVLTCDVSKEEDCRNLAKSCFDRFKKVDVLINNAGFGHYAAVESLKTDDLDAILRTNLFGSIWCIQAFVPYMKKVKKGHIVNVSTVISERSIPFMSAYCMSKFAMNAMDESLRLEVRKWGIGVSLVCPGLTKTDFQTNANRVGYSPPVSNEEGMSAEKVGKIILQAVEKKKRRVYLTGGGKFLVYLQRISPFLTDELMNIFYKKKKSSSV